MSLNQPFLKDHQLGGTSVNGSRGASLVSVIVGVGLLGISAAIISQTAINSRRAQRLNEAKLSSNKSQQAILDAVTERTKEFMLENCTGKRWGGAGATQVEKAFAKIDIMGDQGYGLQAVFTKSSKLNSRCATPEETTLGSGQSFRFCLEIKPTGTGSNSYQMSQMDYRVLEVLLVPVNIATDEPIECRLARGSSAGVKVTWQMFNEFKNSRIEKGNEGSTITQELGTFLVSAETESYAGTCSITASRNGITDQCTVNVSGLGTRPPTLFKDNVEVTAVTWTRPGAIDSFTGTTLCETTKSSVFTAQSAAGTDSCNAPPVQSLCTLNNRVGVWGNRTGGNNLWRTEEYDYPNMIQLPNDATSINIRAGDGDVDDWDPVITINGTEFYSKSGGGTFTINNQIGNLRAGANSVKLKAFNKHTDFTVYFRIRGTYAAQTCTHQISFCEWSSAINTCDWKINR